MSRMAATTNTKGKSWFIKREDSGTGSIRRCSGSAFFAVPRVSCGVRFSFSRTFFCTAVVFLFFLSFGIYVCPFGPPAREMYFSALKPK